MILKMQMMKAKPSFIAIVMPTKAPRSLMAAKSFVKPVKDAKQMQNWIGIMSAELHNRIMTNLEDFSLWPKTLTVSHQDIVSCHHYIDFFQC